MAYFMGHRLDCLRQRCRGFRLQNSYNMLKYYEMKELGLAVLEHRTISSWKQTRLELNVIVKNKKRRLKLLKR